MKNLQSFEEFITEKKKSPFKKATLLKYKAKFEDGEEIPVMIANSLKAQGMIPREDGKVEVSDAYKEDTIIDKLKPKEKKEHKSKKKSS